MALDGRAVSAPAPLAAVVAMRGRKPQPTALKLLRNNPGRRPLNEHEPQHAALDASVPEELLTGAVAAGSWQAAAVGEWRRVIGTLARGQVTTVDRSALLGYCVKFGQWWALETEAAAHPFLVRAPSGYPIPNPALGMANKAFKLMLVAAIELGITPSSRSRIQLAPAEPGTDRIVDEFTAFQRQRRRS